MLLYSIDHDLFVDLFTHHHLEMDDPSPRHGGPFGVVASWRQQRSDGHSHQRRRRMLSQGLVHGMALVL